jgi:hypothetical protein
MTELTDVSQTVKELEQEVVQLRRTCSSSTNTDTSKSKAVPEAKVLKDLPTTNPVTPTCPTPTNSTTVYQTSYQPNYQGSYSAIMQYSPRFSAGSKAAFMKL